MDHEDLRHWGARAADWAADYFASLSSRPVRAPLSWCASNPLSADVPRTPPSTGQPLDDMFRDLDALVMPRMTHWQHPRFFAYFPANNSPPSVLAEWLTAAVGAQGMLWQTSPAATELEFVVVDWFRQMVGLGMDDGHGEENRWTGLIQSGASIATLAFVMVARDRAVGWDRVIDDGLFGCKPVRMYAGRGAHSSVEKAVRLAGIGRNNLVIIESTNDEEVEDDGTGCINAEKLKEAIQRDRKQGFLPAAVIAVIGSTSTGACDDLDKVLRVARNEGLLTHVDAAWAGSALICPELRSEVGLPSETTGNPLDLADSVVINPHKWLLTNFDCTVHFIGRERIADFQRTMRITPAFLRTQGVAPVAAEGTSNDGKAEAESNGQAIGNDKHEDATKNEETSVKETNTTSMMDLSSVTIELGRRFRALKLWFVIRCYGVNGLQAVIRQHIAWAKQLATRLANTPGFEIVTGPNLALFTFRIVPELTAQRSVTRTENGEVGDEDEDEQRRVDEINRRLVNAVNDDGTLYVTQTNHRGRYIVRLSIGSTLTTEKDINVAYDRLVHIARGILNGDGTDEEKEDDHDP